MEKTQLIIGGFNADIVAADIGLAYFDKNGDLIEGRIMLNSMNDPELKEMLNNLGARLLSLKLNQSTSKS